MITVRGSRIDYTFCSQVMAGDRFRCDDISFAEGTLNLRSVLRQKLQWINGHFICVRRGNSLFSQQLTIFSSSMTLCIFLPSFCFSCCCCCCCTLGAFHPLRYVSRAREEKVHIYIGMHHSSPHTHRYTVRVSCDVHLEHAAKMTAGETMPFHVSNLPTSLERRMQKLLPSRSAFVNSHFV